MAFAIHALTIFALILYCHGYADNRWPNHAQRASRRSWNYNGGATAHQHRSNDIQGSLRQILRGYRTNNAARHASCPCPKNYYPVCGDDGHTYENECLLECEGVSKVGDGPCSCICPYIYMPVCGNDGNTYPNACTMECRGIELARPGTCGCICTADYKPVCGSDGVTYPNMCSLECSNVDFDTDGECAPCMCNKIYKPICGADGVTYDNSCEMECNHGGPGIPGYC